MAMAKIDGSARHRELEIKSERARDGGESVFLAAVALIVAVAVAAQPAAVGATGH